MSSFLIFKINRGDDDYDANYGAGGWNDFWRSADCRSSAVALVEHDRNEGYDYHIVDLEGLTLEVFEKGYAPDQLKRKLAEEEREQLTKLEADWLKTMDDFKIKYGRHMSQVEESIFKPSRLMDSSEMIRLKALKLHYLDDLKTVRPLSEETERKLLSGR